MENVHPDGGFEGNAGWWDSRGENRPEQNDNFEVPDPFVLAQRASGSSRSVHLGKRYYDAGDMGVFQAIPAGLYRLTLYYKVTNEANPGGVGREGLIRVGMGEGDAFYQHNVGTTPTGWLKLQDTFTADGSGDFHNEIIDGTNTLS